MNEAKELVLICSYLMHIASEELV